MTPTTDYESEIRASLNDVVQYGFDAGEFNPELVNAVVNLHVTRLLALLDRARSETIVEEIEDIDQSRDVQIEDDGTYWCTYCHMMLETADQECACNIIYQKRKECLSSRLPEEGE